MQAKPYKLAFSDAFRGDLKHAYTWYAEQPTEGLEDSFLESFYSSVAVLEINPFVCQVYVGDVRRLVIDKFKHNLFYQVKNDVVLVIAIFHGKQNPEKTWLKLEQRQ